MTDSQPPASTFPGDEPPPSAPTTPPSTAAPPPSDGRRTARRWLTWIALILTCVVAVSATTAVWTHRTLLNEDAWIENIADPIAEDPAVAAAISQGLTDRIFDAIDIKGRLQSVLPDLLDFVAGTIENSLRERVQTRLDVALRSDEAKTAWEAANRFAHERILAIIRGESETIVSEEGVIYLDMRGLLEVALRALQDAGVIGADVVIPDFTSFETPDRVQAWLEQNLGVAPGTDIFLVPLAESSAIETARLALQVFDVAVIVLIIAAVLLAGLTILVALDRRRATVQLAIGLAVSFAISYLAIGAIQGWIIGQLTTGGGFAAIGRAAVEATLDDLASWTGILVGLTLVVAVVAYFLSGPGWLRALPRTTAGAWAVRNPGAMRFAGIVVPIVLLFLVPKGPVIIIAIVALAVTYQIVYVFMRRDAREMGVLVDELAEGAAA